MEPSLADMTTWARAERNRDCVCGGVCPCVNNGMTGAVLFLHNHYSLPAALIHFYSSNFMVLHLYILCAVLID